MFCFLVLDPSEGVDFEGERTSAIPDEWNLSIKL